MGFARIPSLQGNGTDRDHSPDAFTCCLAGAGAKKGINHGESENFGAKAVVYPVEVWDFSATLQLLMGLDRERLCCHHDGLGRCLSDVHGHVIEHVLAWEPVEKPG